MVGLPLGGMASASARFLLSKSRFLWDEPIFLKLNHPSQQRKITLSAKTKFRNTNYSSVGYYKSQPLLNQPISRLDLTQHRCLGGTFSGLEPQGLFWSLQPIPDQREGSRLMIPCADTELDFELSAYNGHILKEEIDFEKDLDRHRLCSIKITRCLYWPDQVQRLEVRVGRIRGTLFIPKSSTKKTYPGVVDLFGAVGGLVEQRAALLAKEGFVTLALAYFNFEDLPATVDNVNFDYFEEAVDYLLSREEVKGDKVTVVGISKGAEIAQYMPHFFNHKINGVVSINGFSRFSSSLQYKGQSIEVGRLKLDIKKAEFKGNVINLLKVFAGSSLPPEDVDIMPVENTTCKYLLIHANDDKCCPSNEVDYLAQKFHDCGKDANVTILRCAGAGHLMDPPYFPLCQRAFTAIFTSVVEYGGIHRDHFNAQMEFWKKMIEFIHQVNE